MFPPRPYRSDADLDAMRAVLSAGRLVDNGTYYIHPGDLNWWWYYHDPGGAFPSRTFLWEAEGRTIGWAILNTGDVDVYFLPELRGTPAADEMYAWSIRRMAEIASSVDRAISFQSVHDRDRVLIDFLEARGFSPNARCLVHHTVDLENLPEPVPPAGYELRGISGEDEAPSRARASRAAFNKKNTSWESYLENYRNFTHAPVYDPELEVVAVDREGEVGAFAVCWVDPVSRTGLFEPVGTHPDHQRRGLGRAVLLEGLRRMADRGMLRAEVCAFNDNPAALGLYRSVGFRAGGNLWVYQKNLPAAIPGSKRS
jgi:ribosomal protein S18 acetylase RimI-like enzyme